MSRKALVIAPGRGTYTKNELGYLKKHRPHAGEFLSFFDDQLAQKGALTITALDEAAKFSSSVHTLGENASTLIFACSAADFLAIDRREFDIVAVTGNSMGWYTALWCAGALNDKAAFELVHTMGSMMRNGVIGGQLVYPLVDEHWKKDHDRQRVVDEALSAVKENPDARIYKSIQFGGYGVFGGNELGISLLMKLLPPVDEGKFPFRLLNHAAFHTPLLEETSKAAFSQLGLELFQKPKLPLIDGRGSIWQPWSSELDALRNYTLGHQVVSTYDFHKAVAIALKEFAPDCLILLGPGATSGGAIGQILVDLEWYGIKDKDDFKKRQETDPILFALGS